MTWHITACYSCVSWILAFLWNSCEILWSSWLVGCSHILPLDCNKRIQLLWLDFFTINSTHTWFHVYTWHYVYHSVDIKHTWGILMTGHNRMGFKRLSWNLYYFTMLHLLYKTLYYIIWSITRYTILLNALFLINDVWHMISGLI